MAIPDFKLSAILQGHSLDVRSVSVTGDDCILSASRDRTAKLWHPEGSKDFSCVVTYKGHNNFVSSVCWLPPCQAHPYGLVVTGSNDNTICGYNLQDSDPVVVLKGHENSVCFVSHGHIPGFVFSASWDNTAIIWNVDNNNSKVVLKGHQAAVWAVVELGNGQIATCSADKTVILWTKDGTKLKQLTGHTDCVRGLAVLNSDTFVSCANDATIRLWTNQGECLNTFYGHSNYVYCVCTNPGIGSDCFVTCGEDSTVRVWVAGDNVRTITLPAQSIWSVACLSNGDIVTGSSDGLVRVFTTDPGRFADEAILKLFEQEVLKQQVASKQEIGGVKLTDLPGPEILFEPGKADGQTKLVRTGTAVKCYSWNANEQKWNEIGDVMGEAGPTEGKVMFEGKEYDFVFSVDIEDGAPPLKLPFNKNEDPWVVAQAFIHKNNLPQVYLDQVANFIVTNAGQKLSADNNRGFADPFTGESRYIPGSESSNLRSGSQSGMNHDPFTGSSSYSSNKSNQLSLSRSNGDESKQLIPHKSYLKFDQANLALILEKLKEFNRKIGDGFNNLSDDELDAVVKLGDLKASYNIHSVNHLKEMLHWPKDILFPVLDVTRLAIRNEEINKDLFSGSHGPLLIEVLQNNLVCGVSPANQMLSVRVLVNAFAHLAGEMMVLKEHETILSSLICLNNLNKNLQIAVTTLLLNLSVALGQQKDTSLLSDCILQVISNITDIEAYFRGLIALGTLLADSPNKIPLQSKVVSFTTFHKRLKAESEQISNDPNMQKIALCSKEILKLL